MVWPQHVSQDAMPQSEERFLRHLVSRETGIGLAIIVGVTIVAFILAAMLFPRFMLYAAFFYFAYIILFTLPMWASLFEDDIEEEVRRHDHEDAH